MKSKAKNTLYEKDFFLWTKKQVSFLRKGEINAIDKEHLIEEIESLGISQKKALYNHLINLLMHKLKWDYQPEKKTKSWERSINNAKREIAILIKFSPSLKKERSKFFADAYADARKDASRETKKDIKTFPKESPWTIEELFAD